MVKKNMSLIARIIAFEYHKLPRICEKENCGCEIVEVHHEDKNRENNEQENLRILCRRHHNDLHGIIPPKKEPLPEVQRLIRADSPKKVINIEKRRLATEAYRKKWEIV